jgi:hypothetical protein
MPLINDVLTQLGKSLWFSTLDLQLSFGHIIMSNENV